MALCATFFLTQVVVLRGANSAFRLPKETVAEAGLALCLALFLAVRLRRGTLEIPRSGLVWVLATYPALAAVSALWSASPRDSLEAAAGATVWVAAAVFLALLDDDDRDRVVRWAALGAAVSAMVFLAQLAGLEPLQGLVASRSVDRFQNVGLAGNPADLAIAALLLLPLLVHRAMRIPGWRPWVLPAILSLVAAMTRTMTALLVLGALAAVILVIMRSRKLWFATAALLTVAGTCMLVVGGSARVVRTVRWASEGRFYESLSGRTDGWTAALEMFRNQPLHGVGAAAFDSSYYDARLAWIERTGERVHPRGELGTHFEVAHSDPLQAMAELGLPGLAWLAAVAAGLFATRRRSGTLLPLGLAAYVPFAALHYPTHLATGLCAVVLLVAGVLSSAPRRPLAVRPRAVRAVLAAVLVAAACAWTVWLALRLEQDHWYGRKYGIVKELEGATGGAAEALLAQVERSAEQRLSDPACRPDRMLLLIGHVRMNRKDYSSAESAYRASLSIRPHESTEFALGLALAYQGKRSEAIHHLARVCRSNPRLRQLISDEQLRDAVGQYNRQRWKRRARSDAARQ